MRPKNNPNFDSWEFPVTYMQSVCVWCGSVAVVCSQTLLMWPISGVGVSLLLLTF